MENKFTKPIWFPATFVLTCSLFINSALYAFTLEAGQNLNSRELAQYQLSSPIKVGEITVREFINPSVPDANKTFVVIPASGLVGVSKNEVIVSGLELASLNKVTNSFTAEIEQKKSSRFNPDYGYKSQITGVSSSYS